MLAFYSFSFITFTIRITVYKELYLQVEPYYSTLTVKVKIESTHKVSRSQQTLFYNNYKLQDSAILSEIGKTHGAILSLQIEYNQLYIYCLLWPVIIKPFYVKPSNTIANLMEMIKKEIYLYPIIKSIEFNDQTLEESRYISEYKIKLGSMLNVVAHLDYTKDYFE